MKNKYEGISMEKTIQGACDNILDEGLNESTLEYLQEELIADPQGDDIEECWLRRRVEEIDYRLEAFPAYAQKLIEEAGIVEKLVSLDRSIEILKEAADDHHWKNDER